ncbi:MAG: RICIN domain-containing protein [Phycisphaeraceae bacterium]|nr:MAG: RICIN domain-containing protein [Phycisphaeraceae bacterium]
MASSILACAGLSLGQPAAMPGFDGREKLGADPHAGLCTVDRDGDGSLTIFDLLDYLRAYDAGCDFGAVPSPATTLPNTIFFNHAANGNANKSVETWGPDTSWADSRNVRVSVQNMGVEKVDVVRVSYFLDVPLTGSGGLGSSAISRINDQLALAAMADNAPLTLTPSGDPDPYYRTNNEPNAHWIDAIKATKAYIAQQTGKQIAAVELYNEPDWASQGSPATLNWLMTTLAADPDFNGILLMGASTLNADNATWWYDQIAGPATAGSTHMLGGTLASYANFLPHVASNGDAPFNPEVHSLAEAIVGADRGMQGGMWWGAIEYTRGLFIRSSDGSRLGYAENLGNQAAACVYRAPDGQIRAFAGGIERAGWPTQFPIYSVNGSVYYDGVGPIRSYALRTDLDQHTHVDVDTDPAAAMPPLDGYRWKIVNRLTGRVLEVAGGGTQDGDPIRTYPDTGGLHQSWDIRRHYRAYGNYIHLDGYFALLNANSGLAAEVANFSLDDNASVRQWGASENMTRSWYVEKTGDGYFYIRNANSNSYLTAATSSAVQFETPIPQRSEWSFVLANPDPASGLRGSYSFEGDNGDAISYGGPVFANSGVCTGLALEFDGTNDYVRLPVTIANTDDITVAAWVKWDGGAAWQRVFDFGNDETEYMFLTPMSDQNTMQFSITTGGLPSALNLEADPIPVGVWTHVAVTLGGNTAVLYVNGRPVCAGQFPIDTSDFNPLKDYLGRSQWSQDPYFDGMIDEFQVYGFALSHDQIGALAVGCCDVDLAPPFEELNADDMHSYLEALDAGCP